MENIVIKGTKQTQQQPYVSFPKTDYWKWLEQLNDGEEIIIEISCKRSLNQNNLFHKCVSIISNEIGYDFDTCKVWLVCKFFGCREEEVEGNIYTIPVSTSRLSKKDFANGLTNLYQWAEEQNIHLPIIY